MTLRSTTILAVRRDGHVVVGGDGQVTLNATVVKGQARKVRRMSGSEALAGFAGSAADGMTLFDRFEAKLESHGNNLRRAAVELAKDWRADKMLRRLEAMMIVSDRKDMFLLSGNGDVIEPDIPVLAIGSGGNYALSAARALIAHSKMNAREVVEASLSIAADLCVYTNSVLTLEELS